MAVDLLFPGSVVILKSLFRLTVDNDVNYVRTAKAFFAFPVDINFLAFSYAATSMIVSPQEVKLSVGGSFAFLVAYIICGVLVTVSCNKIDRAFDAGRDGFVVIGSISAYVFSFSIIGYTIFGGIF